MAGNDNAVQLRQSNPGYLTRQCEPETEKHLNLTDVRRPILEGSRAAASRQNERQAGIREPSSSSSRPRWLLSEAPAKTPERGGRPAPRRERRSSVALKVTRCRSSKQRRGFPVASQGERGGGRERPHRDLFTAPSPAAAAASSSSCAFRLANPQPAWPALLSSVPPPAPPVTRHPAPCDAPAPFPVTLPPSPLTRPPWPLLTVTAAAAKPHRTRQPPPPAPATQGPPTPPQGARAQAAAKPACTRGGEKGGGGGGKEGGAGLPAPPSAVAGQHLALVSQRQAGKRAGVWASSAPSAGRCALEGAGSSATTDSGPASPPLLHTPFPRRGRSLTCLLGRPSQRDGGCSSKLRRVPNHHGSSHVTGSRWGCRKRRGSEGSAPSWVGRGRWREEMGAGLVIGTSARKGGSVRLPRLLACLSLAVTA